jgi:hypothetical protein
MNSCLGLKRLGENGFRALDDLLQARYMAGERQSETRRWLRESGIATTKLNRRWREGHSPPWTVLQKHRPARPDRPGADRLSPKVATNVPAVSRTHGGGFAI